MFTVCNSQYCIFYKFKQLILFILPCIGNHFPGDLHVTRNNRFHEISWPAQDKPETPVVPPATSNLINNKMILNELTNLLEALWSCIWWGQNVIKSVDLSHLRHIQQIHGQAYNGTYSDHLIVSIIHKLNISLKKTLTMFCLVSALF